MPSKRARDDTAQEFQNHKKEVNDAVAEFVCPITQSLPLDPVMADDGKVYEKYAISEWLSKHQRSPLTNETMSTRLVPALQIKNMIRTMVRSGAIIGDNAEEWRQKIKDEDHVEDVLRKAKVGNANAMYDLANMYRTGNGVLKMDETKAFEWFEKSHEAGCVSGTAMLGCYPKVGDNLPLVIVYLTSAAILGSQLACRQLAVNFQKGLHGFLKDLKQARYWHLKVKDAIVKDLVPKEVEASAAWVVEHTV
tara:strand:+ start:1755 stop:2504 length:750 start_codon:yes stop_codon:yes gene_type:complete